MICESYTLVHKFDYDHAQLTVKIDDFSSISGMILWLDLILQFLGFSFCNLNDREASNLCSIISLFEWMR